MKMKLLVAIGVLASFASTGFCGGLGVYRINNGVRTEIRADVLQEKCVAKAPDCTPAPVPCPPAPAPYCPPVVKVEPKPEPPQQQVNVNVDVTVLPQKRVWWEYIPFAPQIHGSINLNSHGYYSGYYPTYRIDTQCSDYQKIQETRHLYRMPQKNKHCK